MDAQLCRVAGAGERWATVESTLRPPVAESESYRGENQESVLGTRDPELQVRASHISCQHLRAPMQQASLRFYRRRLDSCTIFLPCALHQQGVTIHSERGWFAVYRTVPVHRRKQKHEEIRDKAVSVSVSARRRCTHSSRAAAWALGVAEIGEARCILYCTVGSHLVRSDPMHHFTSGPVWIFNTMPPLA